MSICLVLLIGIPCSGKTFFRLYLESYFKENFKSVLGSVTMCSVCYDDFVQIRNPQCFPNETNWKEERLKVLKSVKLIISHFLGLINENTSTSTVFHNVGVINESVDKPQCILIVIDDNMYYRSMRYEYFKLAKEYNVSFFQIYFHIALEKALMSNVLRTKESQVPPHIITSMFGKIEPPDTNHTWEDNSISLQSYVDFQNEIVARNVLNHLKNALLNPIKAHEPDSFIAKEISRQITNTNVLHNIDNALKQIVGECIKEEIKANKTKIQETAQHLSNTRLDILKKIKDGLIVLPINLTKPISEEDITTLKPVLLMLLKKMT